MNSSANALYAIAHSKFGKRLRKSNYDEMIGLGSVVDVAGYLRKKTVYGEALESVKDGTIHRGHLEELLRGHVLKNVKELERFGTLVGLRFSEVIESEADTKELLKFFRLYNAGRPEEYVFVMPTDVKSIKGVNITKLSEARSVEDVVAAVKASDLCDVVKKIPPGDRVDYTAVEVSLSQFLVDKIDTVAKRLDSNDRKEFELVFGIKCELDNVERIYRMKRFGYSDPTVIKSFLIKKSCHIEKEKLDKMINASSADEVLNIFRTTYYGKDAEKFEFVNIDNFLKSICYKNTKKLFRFSTSPIVCVITYMMLSEYELANVIQIVEGVRYDLPREEIRSLLTGYEEA